MEEIKNEAVEEVVTEEPKKMRLNLATASRIASGWRNRICKNGVVEVIETGIWGATKEPYYDVRGDGCREMRRNGSAYCQKCSDEHKKTNEN